MPLLHDPEICRGILESLPCGLCVVDLQQKIVFWSDGAERITGHLRYEVIGHSCISEALLHCNQSSCEFCRDDSPIQRTMKTSQPIEAVGFLHHKTGFEVPVRIRAVPVHDPHGSVIGAAETFEELQHSVHPDARDYSAEIPAAFDETTAVASHILMHSHLRRAMATFVERNVPFSLLSLRLEGLAHFRASLGPEAGASLLRVIARSLECTLWTTDVIGRWSDDQFLAILNGCSEPDLPIVRERVRRTLAVDGIEWWGDIRSLPVLIGEASVHSGDSVESIVERSQESMNSPAACRTLAAASGGNSGS